MVKTENFEKVQVESAEELRGWLHENHAQPDSVWLVTFKKDAGDLYVSREQVLDELVCFGWIDGIRRKLDDSRTMQLISPRRAQHWAQTYKDRAQRLIDEGLMMPPGLARIEESKANGLWNFMDDVDALIKPDDFAAALKERPGAMSKFDGLAPSTQRFTLRWIKLAKTEKTRRKRINTAADLAARGDKIPGS